MSSKRLLVNPGTPQAWEIALKPGVNRIGRNEQNDFPIPHGSVSGSHCEVVVGDAGVTIKDLGSTNGTFVNRARITESTLVPGCHLQLGSVDMTFDAGVPVAVALSAAPPPPAPTPMRVHVSAGLPPVPPPVSGLRISKPHAEEPAPAEASVAVADDTGASGHTEVPMLDGGDSKCRFHPKSPARFLCGKCQTYFCDLCVTTRASAKFCRKCGQGLTPLRLAAPRFATERGFYGRLPGAFIFPFKGFGVVCLILATIAFLALEFVSMGIFSIFAKAAVYGFVFLFMQNIIHTTASDENEPLSFPDASGLYGAAFQLGATILFCFALPIGLLVARFFEVDVPQAAIIGSFFVCMLYFPMAFLAVAMKDSVIAMNPLVVIPTIFRIPLEYLVAAILTMSVFGVRLLGNVLAGVAGEVSLTTRDMSTLFMALGGKLIWTFISVYLLVVSMRILGLLYVSKKEKFGWF